MIYACTRDKTLMIDVQAREITEKDLAAALRLAHPEVFLKFLLNLLVLCNSICSLIYVYICGGLHRLLSTSILK